MGTYITKPKQNGSNPEVMESEFVTICPLHRKAVPTVIRIGDYEIFKVIMPYTNDKTGRYPNGVQLRYRNLRKVPYGPNGRRFHYLPRRRRVSTPLRVKVLKREAWKLLENNEEVKASLKARLRKAARENRLREKIFQMKALKDKKDQIEAKNGEPNPWQVTASDQREPLDPPGPIQ